MKHSDPPIVVEQVVDATPEHTWRALTDVSRMRKWFFPNIPDFRAEAGFQTSFPVVSDGRTFTHQWQVEEVVPLQRLACSWKYAEYPGEALVTYALEGRDRQTLVRVTCLVRQDFDDRIPEFRRESCTAGWQYFIGQALKEFLEQNLHS